MTARKAEAHLAEARRHVARWNVAGAREAAMRARSVAGMWGDAEAVLLADVLDVRTTLLVGSAPSARLCSAAARASASPEVHAAVLRFDAELSLLDPRAFPPPSITLGAGSLEDEVAAAATAGVVRFLTGTTTIRLANGPTPRGPVGWTQLLAALDAEAAGESGADACGRALAVAAQDEDRCLEWTAQTLRAAMAERRGDEAEAASAHDAQRSLLTTWFHELPPLDAESAARRVDRAPLLGPADAYPGDAGLLVELSMLFAEQHEPLVLADLALDAAVRLAEAERGLLLFTNPTGGPPIVVAQRFVDAEAERQGIVGISTTVASTALRTGEVVACEDVRSSSPWREVTSFPHDVTSVLCVPIRARGAVEGAIYLDRRERRRPFDRRAIEMAQAVGGILAAALVTSRVVLDLEARTKELDAAREELATALAARTIERDDALRKLHDVDEGMQLVGSGAAMRRLNVDIKRAARSTAPVLILGQTGTGKELVARALHDASARASRPFLAVNCAAFSATLLEAELFGAERGAYTGAVTARPGLFASVDGGTLFLDEVGDMPAAMQVALLRVLESGEIRAVGASRSRHVDVRLLAATHRDLHAMVAEGSFRADLLYRLEVVRIDVPPLADRREDIPELAEHLLADVRERYQLPARRLSVEALDALSHRSFPGNVRELRHVLARAALAATDTYIVPADLPPEPMRAETAAAVAPVVEEDGHAERADSIRRALRATAGHRGKAAERLGISKSTFYRYLETYAIDLEEFKAPKRAS